MGIKNKYLKLLLGLLIIFTACLQQPRTEEQIVELAKDIHEHAITLDTHVDIGRNYATEELDPGIDNVRLKCDLVKMKKGGMDGVFLAVYVPQRPELNEEGYQRAREIAEEKFQSIHRLTSEMYPERCELATFVRDVKRIIKSGKKAIMIGIENGYPIGEDLSYLKKYYDLGTRYITLSHNRHNQICDSSSPDEPLHNGLSDFGKKVVEEMNRLGIMIDVSHISVESFRDVIEYTKAPIIASHSGCYALNPHNRNLNDEQLKALVKNGGAIQIIPISSFVKPESPEYRQAMAELWEELELPERRALWGMSEEKLDSLRPKLDEFNKIRKEIEKKIPAVNLKDYVDHIDHAVKIAGIDHVGIGTDFDGGGGLPGFNNHAEALNVTIELVRRGYSKKDIMKIWGGNLLRVWQETEKIAATLKKNN